MATSSKPTSSDTTSDEVSSLETAVLGGNVGDPPNFPHMSITSYKLNGRNYLQWSQSVLLYICSREKEGYLTNEVTKPEENADGYRTWKKENSQVMSWLINSMMPNIGENFFLLETAAEVWEAAKETYSHKDNTPELVTIEGALHDLRQGDLSVTDYYNKLQRYWQQLDAFEKYKWSTAADLQQYKKIIETKRVYKFCLGLNPNLDAVRGRIFGIKPLPSLREAFSEIRREESRRTLMLGAEPKEPKEAGGEASALAARSTSEPRKGGRPWCDHCRKPGHIKDKCWKIYGKPTDWKPAKERDSKANLSSFSVVEPFSKEQLELLQKLIAQGQPSQVVIGSGTVAQKGFALGEDDWQC